MSGKQFIMEIYNIYNKDGNLLTEDEFVYLESDLKERKRLISKIKKAYPKRKGYTIIKARECRIESFITDQTMTRVKKGESIYYSIQGYFCEFKWSNFPKKKEA